MYQFTIQDSPPQQKHLQRMKLKEIVQELKYTIG